MWTFIKDAEPEIGAYIRVIWSDGTEDDAVWSGYNPSLEPIPVLWQYK